MQSVLRLDSSIQVLIEVLLVSFFAAIPFAHSAEETTAAVLKRYNVTLDAVECHDQEPPGQIKGCEFKSRGITVHICFVYDSKYLFAWKEGWDKLKSLRQKYGEC